jgi:hypothetical protein
LHPVNGFLWALREGHHRVRRRDRAALRLPGGELDPEVAERRQCAPRQQAPISVLREGCIAAAIAAIEAQKAGVYA